MSTAVLLAEPEPDTRGFLERHLADDGFDVFAAEPTELRDANGSSPDVVLLGDTSALEACRLWNRDVPVIVLGGPGSDTVDRVRAFERGCDDWVDRPLASLFASTASGIRRISNSTGPESPRRTASSSGVGSSGDRKSAVGITTGP
jgi:DNA-binding response OmpR family regulator